MTNEKIGSLFRLCVFPKTMRFGIVDQLSVANLEKKHIRLSIICS